MLLRTRILPLVLDLYFTAIYRFKIMNSRSSWLAILPALLAVSCVTQYEPASRQDLGGLQRPIIVEAPTDAVKRASAGDRMFIKGTLFEVDCISIPRKVRRNIGRYSVLIEPTQLPLTFQTPAHLLYVAPRDSVLKASFTSQIISPYVTHVGIRENKSTGELSWFIDSQFGAYAEREYTSTQNIEHERKKVTVFSDSGEWSGLHYDGFYDNKVHFELLESGGSASVERRKFQFNLTEGEASTQVAIKGFVLEILAVDNLGLQYRWIRID